MRHATLAFALPLAIAVALPMHAEAGPITAGVQLGSTSTREEADAGQDPRGAYGIYGRLRISPRIAAQLELGRIDTDSTEVSARQLTALVVVDIARLGAARRLVPTVMLGLGVDHVESWGTSLDASRVEAGLGLEYRAEGGLTVGLDLRMGERTFENQVYAQPVYDAPPGAVPLDPIAGGSSTTSEFRAARVTVGIAF